MSAACGSDYDGECSYYEDIVYDGEYEPSMYDYSDDVKCVVECECVDAIYEDSSWAVAEL